MLFRHIPIACRIRTIFVWLCGVHHVTSVTESLFRSVRVRAILFLFFSLYASDDEAPSSRFILSTTTIFQSSLSSLAFYSVLMKTFENTFGSKGLHILSWLVTHLGEWILRFYYDININYDLSSHAWKGNSTTALNFLHATHKYLAHAFHATPCQQWKQLSLLMRWQLQEQNSVDKDRTRDERTIFLPIDRPPIFHHTTRSRRRWTSSCEWMDDVSCLSIFYCEIDHFRECFREFLPSRPITCEHSQRSILK